MVELNTLIWITFAFYFIFILLRYWQKILIFEIAAIVPLVVLMMQFGTEAIELTILLGGLMLVHIGGFVFGLMETY